MRNMFIKEIGVSNNIRISGITNIDQYPIYSFEKYCKECISNKVLSISDEKIGIDTINEIKISISVDKFEIFKNIFGSKLLLRGIKNIKILYTASNKQKSLHSNSWVIPFCEFVILQDLNYQVARNAIKDIFIGVEKVHVKTFKEREIDLAIIFIICPEFRCNYKEFNKNRNYTNIYRRNNIYYNR